MPEPSTVHDDLPETLPGDNPTLGLFRMRADCVADLSTVRVTLDQFLVTLPFLRVDPEASSMIRGLLTRAREDTARAAALTLDQSLLPADGGAEA